MMHHTKKLLSVLLAAVMLASTFSLTAFAEEPGGEAANLEETPVVETVSEGQKAAEEIAGSSAGENTGETAEAAGGETSGEIAEEAGGETAEEAGGETAGEADDETAKETAEAAGGETAEETAEAAGDETAEAADDETAGETAEAASGETAEAANKEADEEAAGDEGIALLSLNEETPEEEFPGVAFVEIPAVIHLNFQGLAYSEIPGDLTLTYTFSNPNVPDWSVTGTLVFSEAVPEGKNGPCDRYGWDLGTIRMPRCYTDHTATQELHGPTRLTVAESNAAADGYWFGFASDNGSATTAARTNEGGKGQLIATDSNITPGQIQNHQKDFFNVYLVPYSANHFYYERLGSDGQRDIRYLEPDKTYSLASYSGYVWWYMLPVLSGQETAFFGRWNYAQVTYENKYGAGKYIPVERPPINGYIVTTANNRFDYHYVRAVTVTWLREDGTQIKQETIPNGSSYSELYPDDPGETGKWGDPAADDEGNITIQWTTAADPTPEEPSPEKPTPEEPTPEEPAPEEPTPEEPTPEEPTPEEPAPEEPTPEEPTPEEPAPEEPAPVEPAPVTPAPPAGPVIPAAPEAPDVPAAPAEPVETTPEEETPLAGPEAAPAAPAEEETLEEEATPLAGIGRPAWALLNLILMLCTALASILLLIGFIGKKQKELRDENGDPVLDAEGHRRCEWIKKRHGGWRLFSLAPALGAIIAFILTEDIRLPMVFTDRWTLLMALIALVQVITCVFSMKDKQQEDDTNNTTGGPAPARA